MRLRLQNRRGNASGAEMRENRRWRLTKVQLHPWIAAVAVAACAFAGVPGSTSSSLGLVAAAAQDKDSFTPMPLDSGFGRMDLSDPALPPEQIIKRVCRQGERIPGCAEPLHLPPHGARARAGRRQQGRRRVVRGGRRDLRSHGQAHGESGTLRRQNTLKQVY